MARDLVDAAAADLPFTIPASRTDEVLLVGAEGFEDAWADREGLGERTGLGEAQARRMLRRYGGDVGEVLALGADDHRLLQPVHPEAPVLGAEVRYAVTHEGARHLEDVLLRRTRLAFTTWDGARSVAADVARLIASELGWDEARVAEEVAAFEIVAPHLPVAAG
jgi:glycerol-3-phosphate dehydrogenase